MEKIVSALTAIDKSIDGLVGGLGEYRYIFVYAAVIFFLILHHLLPARKQIFLFLMTTILFVISIFAFFIAPFEKQILFKDIVLFTVVYSFALYVFLCGLLQLGIARWLTKWRGEKWTKEIDYVYLTLGALGVLGSINRIQIVSGRIDRYEIWGPLVIATALVIRFIKTRIEIARWNKIDHPAGRRKRGQNRKSARR